jgi:hypothetical protein
LGFEVNGGLMDAENIKLIIAIIGLILSILSFLWNIFKDWEKIPSGAKKFFGFLFRQWIAWLILLVISASILLSSLMERNPEVLTLEKVSVVSTYFYPKVNPGVGYMGTTLDNRDGKPSLSYWLEYDLPQSGDAFTGIALDFPEPIDVSIYKTIELTVLFSDEQARFRLFLKDAYNEDDFVLLGDGNIVSAKNQPQVISLPLATYFPSVARTAIKEIDIDVNNYFAQGQHNLTVSNIAFRK